MNFFSFSLFISPPYSTVTNDQLLQKKMCFIYRAQLMEVLLYLLAGNYVSLLYSALCCKHDSLFLCCSMACWLRPNAPRSILQSPLLCITYSVFVVNGSLCLFLTCLSLSSPFKKTAVPCGQAFWSFKNGSKSGARLEVALIYFHLATIIALC